MDKLVINVHASKVYKQYEKIKTVFDKIKDQIPNGMLRAEMQVAIEELEEEAHMVSYNHATFHGLLKQYTKKMEEVGLDKDGLPRDDNGKIVVFKSQAEALDILLKLVNTLGTYYDTK